MAKTNWQDPKSGEIISPHISGLQEAVGKLEESVGIESKFEENTPMSEVFISNDDRCRIYQAPEGKRNWLPSPAPIIKKNGVVITDDFSIDYGGGAVVFTTPLSPSDILTVDASFTLPSDRLDIIELRYEQEVLETRQELYIFGNTDVSMLNGACDEYSNPCNPLGYVVKKMILGGVY